MEETTKNIQKINEHNNPGKPGLLLVKALSLIKEKKMEMENHGLSQEKKEQARTTFKKNLFKEVFRKTKGVIYISCKKAGITDWTYHYWMRNDPQFKADIEKIEKEKNNVAADILWSLVTVKRDPTSVRYYLDRRHPDFKPHQVQENVGLNGESVEIQIIKNHDETKGDNGIPKELECDGKPQEPTDSEPGGDSQ